MSRPKVLVNKDNAEKIYQYFSKSIFEKRSLNDKSNQSIDGKMKFLELGKNFNLTEESQKLLHDWIDEYVPIKKWTHCLATIRQTQSTRKHDVKSIKLNMETYTIFKKCSDHFQISIQETIMKAIKPLWGNSRNEFKKISIGAPSTELSPVEKQDMKKQMQLKLHMYIENNSRFVRGEKKVRENIERYHLSQYQAQKIHKDGNDYILTIPYETEEELNETIDELYEEMNHEADIYHCYVEADIYSIDGEKSW